MVFNLKRHQKTGIVPEMRIGFFHHFGMVESDGAEKHGKWCQSHRDAMVVVGTESQRLLAQFRQLGSHGLYPIRLFEGEVVETRENGVQLQSGTGGGHRRIEVGMLGKIEV